MADYRRILLIKPSSFGDIVHALPAFRAVRRRFPRAHLAWLVKRPWADLLRGVEGLDQVWPVEPTVRGWLEEVPRLRAAGFDAALDLQGLFRSGAMGWLAGCPVRVGLAEAREGAPLFYTKRVAVPDPTMHVIDRYLLAASALWSGEAQGMAEPWDFGLTPLSEDRDRVATLLAEHGVTPGAPWIAANVSARWPTKQWPAELFAEALDGLQRGTGRVALIGAPDERERAAAVKRLMTTTPVDLTGATSVALLPALLESATVVISGDSGPMHLAAAVGTPVVGLFGPSSPGYSGPRGDRHRLFVGEVPCAPCFRVACRNEEPLACLRRITPGMVVEAVRDRMAARLAAR